MIVCAASLAMGVSSAQSETNWPSRSTAMHSTLGWFQALNAHDRHRLLFYVAPSARDQVGWARPTVSWSKFTDLRCHPRQSLAKRRRAAVRCTFHESASITEGKPGSFLEIEIRHTRMGWLIYSYGQG